MNYSSSEVEKELKMLFCRMLDLEEQEIGLDTAQENTPTWDSLAHLNLLMEIDLNCGTHLVESASEFKAFDGIRREVLGTTGEPAVDADRSENEGDSVCFIGACCSILIFRWLGQIIRQYPELKAKKKYYQDVSVLLNFFEKEKFEDRASIFNKLNNNIELLIEPYFKYVRFSETVCFSQIFQLPILENNIVINQMIRCFEAYGLKKRWIFIPNPFIEDEYSLDLIHFSQGADYLKMRVMSASEFSTQIPAAEIIDSHRVLEHFYRINGSHTFYVHPPAMTSPGNRAPSAYSLDAFHYLNDFWGYFTSNAMIPTLFRISIPWPLPDKAKEIEAYIEKISSLAKGGEALASADLTDNTFPSHIVHHAIQVLWYREKKIRFRVLDAILRDETGFFYPMLSPDLEWLSLNDLDFTLEQVEDLDALLAGKTDGYTNAHLVRSYFLFVCLLSKYVVNHPRLRLSVKAFMTGPTGTPDLSGLRTRVLSRIGAEYLAMPIDMETVTGAWNQIKSLGEKIKLSVAGRERWVLFGAGAIAEGILWGLGGKEYLPAAIMTSFSSQVGSVLAGVRVVSIEEAKALMPELIVIATGPGHYPDASNLLNRSFPGTPLLPVFGASDQKTASADDLPGAEGGWLLSHLLIKRMGDQAAGLVWQSATAGKYPRGYSIRELVRWGRAILSHSDIPFAPGDVVPVILPTSPAIYALYYHCFLCGLIPSVLCIRPIAVMRLIT